MADDTLHALTTAEIDRLVGQYNRERLAATCELATIGDPLPDPPASVVEATELAVEMLNGFAPAGMRLQPTIPTISIA